MNRILNFVLRFNIIVLAVLVAGFAIAVGGIAIAQEVAAAAASPSTLDSILALLTRPETLTAIVTIIAAVIPAVGLPVWATTIITGAAGVVVPYIEQTSKEGATSAEKKAAGMKAMKEAVPLFVRVLPGTAKKIDKAIEAKVYDLTL